MIQRFENPIFKSSFLLLLFIPLQLVSFELTFAILFILTILLLNRGSQKISGDFITVILFLLILFLIGISTPFFYNYQLWDIAKDVSYFLKPILLLFWVMHSFIISKTSCFYSKHLYPWQLFLPFFIFTKC